MPRLRVQLALCALSVSAALAGCTTADLAGDIVAEPQFSLTTPDPDLPEAVDAVPFAASSPAAPAEDFVPVAFAGPTPDNPAIAARATGAATAALAARPAIAARSPELDALIARYAAHHEIPLELLRRVVNRESTFNPAARNGPYWGLMQILPQTARTMGYRGPPEGLLDAETNLIYAGKYLRGAYLVADGNHDRAVRLYAAGYYYHARDRGMLEATGLGRDRRRMR